MFNQSINEEILEPKLFNSSIYQDEIIPFTRAFTGYNSLEINSIDENFLEISKSNMNNAIFIAKKEKTSRGRKSKRYKMSKYIHSKNVPDNILRKIKIHFLSFIIDYANAIILEFTFERKKDEFFKNINSKFKQNANKKFFNNLKNKDIGYILQQNISDKFKKLKLDNNKNLYYKAIQNNDIKNLFSENFLSLFNSIYYKNIRKINYNQHIIDLYNANMFEDLLKKVHADIDIGYRNNIFECIKKNFSAEDYD